MAYRGDDLDLRTPQSWGSAGREASAVTEPNWWTRSTIYKGGRNDPIWVDDHVMACCNHAYDLAVAHRAPEVRLEHLINALTLNDYAAQVLEARGLSVSSLRRESGAAIANDFPSAVGAASGPPKRSEGLEEALRLAADQAYPRRTPVTVEDLLRVLFDMKRDLPALQLLRRHASTWSGRNGRDAGVSFDAGDPRSDLRLDPLPHLSRPQPPQQQRPRFASPAAHDYFSQPAQRDPAVTREPPRAQMREPVTQATVDTFQDSRLDSLERAVRDLGVDLADDRKTIRSLVGDLQRTSAAQADDAGRFRGGLSDRLTALEENVLRSRNEAAALPSAVMDRMAMIERTIDARLADAGRMQGVPTALIDRIAALERTIDARLADVGRMQGVPTALLDRIAALERTIDLRMSEVGRSAGVPQPLLDRMASLERTLELRLSDPTRPSGPSPALLDRLASIERAIETRLIDVGRVTAAVSDRMQALELASQRPVEATLAPLVSQRLDAITQFASKIDALERTFQMLLDRMTGVERKLASAADAKPAGLDLSGIESRLAGIESSVGQTIEQSLDLAPVTDLLSGIEARVSGLERTLDNRTAETGRTVSFIGERLRSFDEAIAGQRTQTIDRLGQIERSLTAYAESTVSAGNSHVSELGEVHEALLKLNANQQTLAGSLDQWRLDNTGDLSVISNRLKLLEDAEERRTPQIEVLTQQLSTMHSALAKREVRKHRFRHWLYGTDEWYTASYDTQRWRARQVEPAMPRPVETVQVVQQRPTPAAPPPSAIRR